MCVYQVGTINVLVLKAKYTISQKTSTPDTNYYCNTTTVPILTATPGIAATTTQGSKEFPSRSMTSLSTMTRSPDTTIMESSSTATAGKYQTYNCIINR